MIKLKKTYKEKGGKYLSISLLITEECIIKDAVIAGDFFAYPPEAIDELQSLLINKNVCDNDIPELINDILSNCEVVGIKSKIIYRILNELLIEGCSKCQEE